MSCVLHATNRICNLSSDIEKNLIALQYMAPLPSLCPQPRERGRMRFHRLQNVQIALDYLKRRQVRISPSVSSNSCTVTLLIEDWMSWQKYKRFQLNRIQYIHVSLHVRSCTVCWELHHIVTDLFTWGQSHSVVITYKYSLFSISRCFSQFICHK